MKMERHVEVSLKVLVTVKKGDTREKVIDKFWNIVDEDHRSLEVVIKEV